MYGMGIGIPLQILFFPIVIIRNLHLFMVTLSYCEEKRSGESAGEILQELCDEQDIWDMFDMFITSI